MINTVVIQGRLTRDPELKTTQSGTSVVSFSIANQRSYAKDGTDRKTDFYDVLAWRQTAEFICRNFRKGQMIGITGRLQTDSYTNREGKTVTRTEILAEQADFLESKKTVDVYAPVEESDDLPAADPMETDPETDFEEFGDEDDLPF